MWEQVQAYLAGQAFSGVVMATRRGEIVFERACGMADKERGVPMTVQTPMPVASSLSKPVTAVAVMQLVEAGRLALDQEIDAFFPAFAGHGITVLHLLNHTAGIQNYVYLRNELPWDLEYAPYQLVGAMAEKKLKFKPGKKFYYSNTGFVMLGLIIEALTGQPLYEYVRERVFLPAGMQATGHQADALPGQARPYIKGQPGLTTSKSLFYACGDIVTTAGDFAKFDRALRDGVLLRPETVRQMETPTYEGRFLSVGLSLVIRNLFGRRSTSHGGYHPAGFTAHFERYEDEEETTLIVLSNNLVKYGPLSLKEMGGCWIAREVASQLFGGKVPFWQRVI